MTKETKVGLIIGLLFIGAVIYVLNWATKPSEYEPQLANRDQIAFQTEPEPERRFEPLPPLSVNRSPLPTVNTPADDTAPLAGSTVPESPPVVQTSAPAERFHIVKPGQTLSQIARIVYGPEHGDKADLILQANSHKVANVHMIYPDMRLLIPPLEGVAPRVSQPRTTFRPAGTYTVKEGDTLSDISSAKLGTCRRWREILDLNRDKLTDEYDLKAGMVLKIPATSGAKLSLPNDPDALNTIR